MNREVPHQTAKTVNFEIVNKLKLYSLTNIMVSEKIKWCFWKHCFIFTGRIFRVSSSIDLRNSVHVRNTPCSGKYKIQEKHIFHTANINNNHFYIRYNIFRNSSTFFIVHRSFLLFYYWKKNPFDDYYSFWTLFSSWTFKISRMSKLE